MKKLALALVASSALVGAAQAEMSSGFYLGAGVGGSSFTSSMRAETHGVQAKSDMGSANISGSVFAGYTGFSNCVLYGLELGYTYANDSITNKFSAAAGSGKVKFSRDHLFNVAVRLGYKLTPSTAAYVRLGANAGKIKVKSSAVDAAGTPARSKDSHSRISFAPGVGFETALSRNLLTRLEYQYDVGKFKGSKTKFHRQQVMLGIAYKF